MIALTRTRRAERMGEADRQRVEAGLGGRVRDDVAGRAHRARARDVDDRAALARGHALADERAQPERALEVDGDHLVEQLLGHLAQRAVERRDAGVVDEHVDAAELAVRRLDEPLELVPAADVARVRERPAAVRHAALRRLAGRRPPCGWTRRRRRRPTAKARAIARPSPRVAAGDERHAAGEVERPAHLRRALGDVRLTGGPRNPGRDGAAGAGRARSRARSSVSSNSEPSSPTRSATARASSSSSRLPTTSQTTSSGCSSTVRSGHRPPAISNAVRGPSPRMARMRSHRRRWSRSRAATSRR